MDGERKVDLLEKALLEARRTEAPGTMPTGWTTALMRDLRGLAADREEWPDAFLPFKRIVTPFASAAGLTAVAALLCLFLVDVDIEADVLSALLEDPSGIVTMSILGR